MFFWNTYKLTIFLYVYHLIYCQIVFQKLYFYFIVNTHTRAIIMHNNVIMNIKYIKRYLYTVICLLFVSAQSVTRYHFNFK